MPGISISDLFITCGMAKFLRWVDLPVNIKNLTIDVLTDHSLGRSGTENHDMLCPVVANQLSLKLILVMGYRVVIMGPHD